MARNRTVSGSVLWAHIFNPLGGFNAKVSMQILIMK